MGVQGPQYHVELMDKDGHILGPDEEGEIVIDTSGVKPLGLFKEYHRDAELTSQANHDGWYHTGDIAYRDRDGYYWFVGRTDDVIKSSGYRIGPFEVESALMTHPAVVESAITGAPDPVRGQVVKATVVLAEGYTPSDELTKELQNHVKKATAPYKYPRVIEYVDELPKTLGGKIKRAEIRKHDETE
jgi:acetyl-CoA synthetase